MDSRKKLDASGCARAVQLILLFCFGCAPVFGQELSADSVRLSVVQKAFNTGNWEEAARLAQGPPQQSAELDLLEGFALAKLQRWDGARLAFEAGHRKAPGDSRFLVELAGVNYKQHNFQAAERELHD